jgi:hypothetical protein
MVIQRGKLYYISLLLIYIYTVYIERETAILLHLYSFAHNSSEDGYGEAETCNRDIIKGKRLFITDFANQVIKNDLRIFIFLPCATAMQSHIYNIIILMSPKL